jgi:predicted Rossmann fold flavoprotein
MTFDPTKETADVAVIGAGGAGLLAGIAAARAGARTVICERMKTPGRKVAISGGGRCNFSNTLDPRSFVRLFGDKNARHLGHALRAFSNQDMIGLLAGHGVEGQLEKGYRLYTKSGRGMDVVQALHSEFEKSGGVLEPLARIASIKRLESGGQYGLDGSFNAIPGMRRARAVVVCTGGLSYPVTGSSGDGYAWARFFGHHVSDLRAALVGLTVEESWTKSLQGLAWPNAAVTLSEIQSGPAAKKKKPLCVERAEILFTHFGISGPVILDVSNTFVASKLRRARLLVDFFPTQSAEQLDLQLLERFKQTPHRGVARALDGLLPNRLLEYLESSLGEEGQCPVNRLPKTARLKLLNQLKQMQLTVTGTRGIEFGEVTAGGITFDEIDPATLQSKLAPGLFFAGEILDVAGRCGGFNLQAAFSMGYLAGTSAARHAAQVAAQ